MAYFPFMIEVENARILIAGEEPEYCGGLRRPRNSL